MLVTGGRAGERGKRHVEATFNDSIAGSWSGARVYTYHHLDNMLITLAAGGTLRSFTAEYCNYYFAARARIRYNAASRASDRLSTIVVRMHDYALRMYRNYEWPYAALSRNRRARCSILLQQVSRYCWCFQLAQFASTFNRLGENKSIKWLSDYVIDDAVNIEICRSASASSQISSPFRR